MNVIGRRVHEVDASDVGDDVSKTNWTVRIIAVPPGEAPLWVREKWVGVELPVARYSSACTFYAYGVLSLPRTWVAQWWGIIARAGAADIRLRGGINPRGGYSFGVEPGRRGVVAREHPASDCTRPLSRLSRGSLPDRRYLIRTLRCAARTRALPCAAPVQPHQSGAPPQHPPRARLYPPQRKPARTAVRG